MNMTMTITMKIPPEDVTEILRTYFADQYPGLRPLGAARIDIEMVTADRPGEVDKAIFKGISIDFTKNLPER